jgi:hypothetical protein
MIKKESFLRYIYSFFSSLFLLNPLTIRKSEKIYFNKKVEGKIKIGKLELIFLSYIMWFTDCTCDLVEEISNNFLF